MVRSYNWLFTGFVIIDEEVLAKRSGTTSDQVYEYLKHLRKSNIIDYVPKNRTPYIYFTKERLNIERLKISKESYDLRKKELINRIEAVIHYATSATKCRSQILLEYFGETDSAPCGNCDVCKSLEILGLSTFEFGTIADQIKNIIETPCTYEKLLLNLEGDQQKLRQVIKWLLDNEKIIYRVDNMLEWAGVGKFRV